MNLRSSQVKIIQDFIASRITELKARQGQGNPMIDTMMDVAITELTGIQETIKYACELADKPYGVLLKDLQNIGKQREAA